jgi:uncharacterized protein (TIGR02594 family)
MAKRTVQSNHGAHFGGEIIHNGNEHGLPDNRSTVFEPYGAINNKLDNGQVFLINHSTQMPVIAKLEITANNTAKWKLNQGQNLMFLNALDAALNRVQVPKPYGVVRQEPKQQDKPVKEENKKREKHAFLIIPEAKDERPLPEQYKVRLLVENESKQYLAVRQNLDVIFNGFSNTCNADQGDTFKIYAFNDYMKDVAEDFKKNRNIKKSISNGLIKPLDFSTETRSDGVLLHQVKIAVPGKISFKMTRIKQTPHTTISELTLDHDSSKKWYVLEAGGPDSKVSGKGRIEKGTYQLAPYSSKNYPNEYQLKKVPGRKSIIMYEYDVNKSLTTGLALGTGYDFTDDKKQLYKVDNSLDAKKEIYEMIGDGEAEVVIEADLSLKILKDNLWSSDEHLNLIAGEASTDIVNKKSPKTSVELVQKAFEKMNIPIIADGDFGGGTRQAWQFFQRYYPNKTNPKDLKSEINQDGLILMDKALLDGWMFKYDEPKWIATARGEIGVKENPSLDESNPKIEEYYKAAGFTWAGDDSLGINAWCGCYVAWVLKSNNLPIVKSSYRAKEWLNYGTTLDKPVLGSIGVKSRVGGGHVGFVVGQSGDGDYVYILGGNQDNSVKVSRYSKVGFEAFVFPDGQLQESNELPLYIKKASKAGSES